MNLIMCTSNCEYQNNGYCTLKKFTVTTEKSCNNHCAYYKSKKAPTNKVKLEKWH